MDLRSILAKKSRQIISIAPERTLADALKVLKVLGAPSVTGIELPNLVMSGVTEEGLAGLKGDLLTYLDGLLPGFVWSVLDASTI